MEPPACMIISFLCLAFHPAVGTRAQVRVLGQRTSTGGISCSATRLEDPIAYIKLHRNKARSFSTTFLKITKNVGRLSSLKVWRR